MAAANPAGSGWATFRIATMDCSAEESEIRRALEKGLARRIGDGQGPVGEVARRVPSAVEVDGSPVPRRLAAGRR